ncbi:MAG: PilZ domain-containing protein [Thermodesulfobacteriota bacterium]
MRAKRNRKRVMLLYKVRFGIGTEPEHSSIITTFSDRGAQIKTNTVYEKGTLLHLTIEKDFWKYEAEAVVVWSKKVTPEVAPYVNHGMGVQFTSLDEGLAHLYDRKIKALGGGTETIL